MSTGLRWSQRLQKSSLTYGRCQYFAFLSRSLLPRSWDGAHLRKKCSQFLGYLFWDPSGAYLHRLSQFAFLLAPLTLEPTFCRHITFEVRRCALVLSRSSNAIEHFSADANVFAECSLIALAERALHQGLHQKKEWINIISRCSWLQLVLQFNSVSNMELL